MEKVTYVHAIMTTKTPDDWAYIRQKVKQQYSKDVNDFVPVFLNATDFNYHNDSTFHIGDILISWWSYGKMPIVLLKDEHELASLEKNKKMTLLSTCVFID